jgi:hypothetical protein
MGQSESFYGHKAREAETTGEIHLRAGYKVAQYITSALAPELSWEQKFKYFEHALRKHAAPPPPLDEAVMKHYAKLQDLVRTHAGQEALRVANAQHAAFGARLAAGEAKYKLRTDAIAFFRQIITSEECPDWFHLWDFNALKALRNKWA